MDNEKLEIVNNEVLPVEETVCNGSSVASTIVPIAAGFGVGLIGGYLLCRFVAKPLMAKIQAKKAEKAKPVEEPKKDEE